MYISETRDFPIFQKSDMKSVTMVVAALKPNLGIGLNGKLPWRLKTEIINFKKITSTCSPNKRNAVIMGRKTWESIPKKFRPLPERLNIVLTRSIGPEQESNEDLVYLSDITKLELILDDTIDKVFLIGGAELYNQFISYDNVNKIILTELETTKDIEMDTFLNWDLSNWTKRSHQDLVDYVNMPLEEIYQENDFSYKYVLYQKT